MKQLYVHALLKLVRLIEMWFGEILIQFLYVVAIVFQIRFSVRH